MHRRCERYGCENLVPESKTKPAAYCSDACRTAETRNRQRVLGHVGLPKLKELVWQLYESYERCRAGAIDLAPEDLNIYFQLVMAHPLIAGSQAAQEPEFSSQPLAGGIGKDAGQGVEAASISTEINQ